MTFIMIDIESDGPIPGDFSMVAFGAVVVHPDLDKTFLRYMRPISDNWKAEALAVGGFTREQTLHFDKPEECMKEFEIWIQEVSKDKRPMFISDNNGFDWQFINWYFHHFLGRNPFGHSSTNLGSLYKGMMKSTFKNFKHLRRTKHDHNPLNDSIGNAEAMLHMIKDMGLKAGI